MKEKCHNTTTVSFYKLELKRNISKHFLTNAFRAIVTPSAILALNLCFALKLIIFITGKRYPRVVA